MSTSEILSEFRRSFEPTTDFSEHFLFSSKGFLRNVMLFAFLLSFFASSKLTIQPHEERAFLAWMRQYNRVFTGTEYHIRFGIFLAKSRWISDFNRGDHTYRLGLNSFACHTPAELAAILSTPIDATRIPHTRSASRAIRADIPDSIDYRDKGVVTGVKDQGMCGSCWAFSAIVTCESNYGLKKGPLIELSEQNLLDCVPGWGCQGGHARDAIEYVIDSQDGKFMRREDYPYQEQEFPCIFDMNKAVASVSSYIDIEYGNEDDLQEKIANYGVASVSMDAAASGFAEYSGGIFSPVICLTSILNHALACVGYGTEGDTDYWILKNSWGANWGEGGYCRLIRNAGNKCGVASLAHVAIP